MLSGNYSQVGVEVLKSKACPLEQATQTLFFTYTQLGIVIG